MFLHCHPFIVSFNVNFMSNMDEFKGCHGLNFMHLNKLLGPCDFLCKFFFKQPCLPELSSLSAVRKADDQVNLALIAPLSLPKINELLVRVLVTCLISNVVTNPCSRPKLTETGGHVI